MKVSTKTVLEPEVGSNPSAQLEGLYHLIILNDDDHTVEYVIEMLQVTVNLTAAQALACTLEADRSGHSIVRTCALEEAKQKRDRIHAYGPDWRLPQSRGSVAALVEPAAT